MSKTPGRGEDGRGGGGGGRGNSNPKQQSILELGKMMDQVVRVKCIGGRELEGVLKGYDDLVNLVLDDTDEYLRGGWPVVAFARNLSVHLKRLLFTFVTIQCSHLLFLFSQTPLIWRNSPTPRAN